MTSFFSKMSDQRQQHQYDADEGSRTFEVNQELLLLFVVQDIKQSERKRRIIDEFSAALYQIFKRGHVVGANAISTKRSRKLCLIMLLSSSGLHGHKRFSGFCIVSSLILFQFM